MPEADWVARRFARSGVAVISVDYRRASNEISFPLPSDDVVSAFHWVVSNAELLGGDSARVLLGGASAGGNLVAGTVIRLLAEGGPLPAGVFLAYPTLHAHQPPPSDELASALRSTPPESRWTADDIAVMYQRFIAGPLADAPSAAVPGTARPEELVGFPPTLMVNDEHDDLRASGEGFARSLIAAGAALELHTAPGTTHGHLNSPQLPQAEATIRLALEWATRTTTRLTAPDRQAHA